MIIINLKKVSRDELVGGDVEENYKIAMDILNGVQSSKSELVFLNAGAALYLYGLTDSIREGYTLDKETTLSGKVLLLLEKIKNNK